MRIALATNFVAPYRQPLFAALAATPDWDLTVFCSCETEFDRRWAAPGALPFACRRSFNLSYRRRTQQANGTGVPDERTVHLPLGLLGDLLRQRPEVVIADEFGARSAIAALYTRLTRRPLLIWFYGTPHTERDLPPARLRLRRALCRRARAFIGMGSEARRYLRSLGIADERIFDAPNAAGHLGEARTENRAAVRAEFGVVGLCYLAAGRLVPFKGHAGLVAAWDAFCRRRSPLATLLLAGDGGERRALERQVREAGLRNVRFAGHIEPPELAGIYAAADVFVFPTLGDPWGLVVNEALQAGLPVVCSRYAGSAPDLIRDGRNGWIVDPLAAADLARGLEAAWDARDQLEPMRAEARASAARLTIARMAAGFRNAVESSLLRSDAERCATRLEVGR